MEKKWEELRNDVLKRKELTTDVIKAIGVNKRKDVEKAAMMYIYTLSDNKVNTIAALYHKAAVEYARKNIEEIKDELIKGLCANILIYENILESVENKEDVKEIVFEAEFVCAKQIAILLVAILSRVWGTI